MVNYWNWLLPPLWLSQVESCDHGYFDVAAVGIMATVVATAGAVMNKYQPHAGLVQGQWTDVVQLDEHLSYLIEAPGLNPDSGFPDKRSYLRCTEAA